MLVRQKPFVIIMILTNCLFGGLTAAEEFGCEIYNKCVEFPLGELSFADRVVTFSPGPGIASPFDDPSASIGIPDYTGVFNVADGTVALGTNGSITLEFSNNRLVDQDVVENGLDLFVFEAGPAVEPFRLEISVDGIDYISLGPPIMGQPTGVDIKPFINPGDEFRFVRITDARTAGGLNSPFTGADIDAVGAIGSVVPEPSTGIGFLLGLVGLSSLRRQHSRI